MHSVPNFIINGTFNSYNVHVLVTDIESALNRLKFIDFTKAFDKVNIVIIFSSRLWQGVAGVAFDWIESYLCNPTQQVLFGGCVSPVITVTCGVPQESISEPLLFLIFH